jgi:hypothetical protein
MRKGIENTPGLGLFMVFGSILVVGVAGWVSFEAVKEGISLALDWFRRFI